MTTPRLRLWHLIGLSAALAVALRCIRLALSEDLPPWALGPLLIVLALAALVLVEVAVMLVAYLALGPMTTPTSSTAPEHRPITPEGPPTNGQAMGHVIER
jgi:hypothetical protein